MFFVVISKVKDKCMMVARLLLICCILILLTTQLFGVIRSSGITGHWFINQIH